ncbi:MAG: D-alanyl-lipoteichoic acid biosynthesis protein DltB [Atopobiaceae bacterium]|nr:D-alanyl-lipoteichoic acid biosynthesis protein DltB [Atopobiaceae bacterium]
MSFYTEPAFFILLIPIVGFAAYLGVSEKRIAPFGLLVSFVMLGLLFSGQAASALFLIAFLVMTLVLGQLCLSRFQNWGKDSPQALMLYRIALGLQLAPIVIYKVGVVFNPSFLGFIGISYISFKAIQVLIEIRDGLIDILSPIEHLYYLIFFPVFTSGPILRSRAFMSDIAQALPREQYLDRLYRGLGWFVLGALYTFVGSPLASWFMWFVPETLNGLPALAFCTKVLGYGLDLFFDFAGYSDMAMGLGLTLGIDVPRNFRAPFVALDIKDFWDRWHMSLSTWLRDFVFMRFSAFALSKKLFSSRNTTASIGFMINMVLMGAWHGITPDYLVYGLYHGVGLALTNWIQKNWKFYKTHRHDTWFKVCEWLVCMVFVFFGFALFGGFVVTPILGLS